MGGAGLVNERKEKGWIKVFFLFQLIIREMNICIRLQTFTVVVQSPMVAIAN